MKAASSFQFACGFALAGLVALPSCDQAKKLSEKFGKKSPPQAAKPFAGPLVGEIPQGSYATYPLQPGRVVVVDFHAEWCGPCKKLGPILEKIANEKNGLMLVGKVNVDNNKEIAAKEGVHGIPDVRIYRDGKLVDQFVGLPPESDVRRRIDAQIEGLPALTPEAVKKTGGATAAPMSKDWLPPGMSRR